jgi:repressor LexA
MFSEGSVYMQGDLTNRQKQFLSFIESFIDEKGYPPSIREIQGAFSLKSTKGVKDHIDRLVEKGYLQRKDGSARALTMSSHQSGAAKFSTEMWAPVVGRVAAGQPVLAAENEEGRMPLPESFLGVKGVFWLKVHGNSMIDEGIRSGDFVLVNPVPFVEQGTVSVVLVDDEATVKRFYKKGDTVRLVPANSLYEAMEFSGEECSRISIAGKVVAVFRNIL